MQPSEVTELLRRAAVEITPSATEGRARVEERAQRHKRHRRLAALGIAVVVCVGVGGLVAGLSSRTRSDQTVKVVSPPTSSVPLSTVDAAGVALLHSYAQPDAQISAVSMVAIKETTWANYVAWAGAALGSSPSSGESNGVPLFTSTTRIYVVVQVGGFNCASIYGCNGHHYSWVVTVVPVESPDSSAMITSSPGTPFPPSFASLAGPETTLTVSTGKITTTPAPPPGTPTIPVPTLVGQTTGLAESSLASKGFTARAQQRPSAVVPKGDVIAQDPPAGALAPAGSTVTITVSTGPPA